MASQYLENTVSLRQIEWGEEAGPLSLTDARLYLRVDHDDEDAQIQAMIDAALAEAAGMTRRVLRLSTWEWAVSGLSGSCPLPLTPCRACTGITVDGQTVDMTAVTFLAGDMTPLFGSVTVPEGFPDGLTVLTLTAGYSATAFPEPIRQWVLCRVADFYEQRESIASSSVRELSRSFVDRLLDPYRILSV